MNQLATVLLILLSAFQQKTVELTRRVADARGTPAASANVQIVKDDEPHANSIYETRSDENGAFDLRGIELGRYRVYAWKPSAGIPFTRYLLFSPAGPQVQVTPTDSSPLSTVALKLPPPYGNIHGCVTDEATSRPISHARIRLELNDDRHIYFETSASDDGKFSLLVPPKPVRIMISAPGYQRGLTKATAAMKDYFCTPQITSTWISKLKEVVPLQ